MDYDTRFCFVLFPLVLLSAQQYDSMQEGGADSSSGRKTANEKALLARIWGNFDSRYMKPLLTHSRPTLLETLPVCCTPIARLLTTTQQMTQVRLWGWETGIVNRQPRQFFVARERSGVFCPGSEWPLPHWWWKSLIVFSRLVKLTRFLKKLKP